MANLISVQIPEEVLTNSLTAAGTINTALKPYLQPLTPADRKNLPKMNTGNQPFVEKALGYAEVNQQFVPPYVNIPELKKDVKLANDLTSVKREIEKTYDLLDDTIKLAGSEAYVAALSFYNSVKQAAKLNVAEAKTIYEDLKKRFEGQGGKAETEKETGEDKQTNS